jgi:cytochrome P450
MGNDEAIEVDLVANLRQRRREEGPVFWNDSRHLGQEALVVLDPQVAQRLEAENFADLTMLDDVADVIRNRSSERVDWGTLRAAWTGQMRHLTTVDALQQLARRMDDFLATHGNREQDLLWLSERVTTETLIPAIVDGLSPRAKRAVIAEVLSKVTWSLSDIDAGRASRLHKPKMIALQLLAGLAVRRELQGRAAGRRPRRRDLADPVVDLLPSLGIGRAVDAVTALLTAITGSPGAAAACLLFELHRHPDWRARMEVELAAIDLPTLCEAPVRNAPTTAKFVKEVLRIWSSPPVVVRSARCPLNHGDIHLQPGQQYVLSAFLIHHGEREWRDPEVFDPERWSAGERRGQCPHGGYVPFGWAPKSCIGANLGMAQLILLAYLLCTRYRLEVTQPERARMAVASLVRPIDFHGALRLRTQADAA